MITMENNNMFYKNSECMFLLNLGIPCIWNLFTRNQFIYNKFSCIEQNIPELKLSEIFTLLIII